tara:strand:+ start:1661 stop:2302 length:642 start_codon:yes stop_codon:yes gene_type:complete
MIKKNFCLVGVEYDFEDFIIDNKRYFLGFFTSKKNRTYSLKKKKLGQENLKDWKKIKKKFNPYVYITIDDGREREKLYKKIYKKNYSNLFVESSYVSYSSKKFLEKKRGIIIQKFAKIMPNVKIGDGVKININCQIHHGSTIGKFSTLAPSSVVLGNVKIGNYTYIGANSTIKQNIKIGNNCIIGAGSVVVKNVKNKEVVAGSPARVLRKNKQ